MAIFLDLKVIKLKKKKSKKEPEKSIFILSKGILLLLLFGH